MVKIILIVLIIVGILYIAHRIVRWITIRKSRAWADKKDQEYEYWAYKRKDFFERAKNGGLAKKRRKNE